MMNSDVNKGFFLKSKLFVLIKTLLISDFVNLQKLIMFFLFERKIIIGTTNNPMLYLTPILK